MKILKLHIEGYKNLNNVTIDFKHSNGRTLIIGNNGTGKSNVLEVLSAIFNALYCKAKNVSPAFQFELEYEIGSRSAYPRTYPYGYGPNVINVCNKKNTIKLTANSINIEKEEWERFLPKRVVAVYSGEEKKVVGAVLL